MLFVSCVLLLLFLVLLLNVWLVVRNAFRVVPPVIRCLVRRDDYARRLPNFLGIFVIVVLCRALRCVALRCVALCCVVM